MKTIIIRPDMKYEIKLSPQVPPDTVYILDLDQIERIAFDGQPVPFGFGIDLYDPPETT